ncbi:hypothetical protein ADUPG1_013122 [Aduncisulcus paluster]|uniref:SP-RING-type domain-containing protein n=1 Tax=Aduncisulcus paluster TaxID=2918883 RepID=A0ABQ5K1V3_9EUKA|nr:hypothetical protein ADUPG1_013122 [Aduncisulcus paluster]
MSSSLSFSLSDEEKARLYKLLEKHYPDCAENEKYSSILLSERLLKGLTIPILKGILKLFKNVPVLYKYRSSITVSGKKSELISKIINISTGKMEKVKVKRSSKHDSGLESLDDLPISIKKYIKHSKFLRPLYRPSPFSGYVKAMKVDTDSKQYCVLSFPFLTLLSLSNPLMAEVRTMLNIDDSSLPQSSILMHPFSSSKCHLTLSIGKQRREYSHRMKGVDSAKIDEVTFDRTGKFVDITDMIVQYFKEKILEFVTMLNIDDSSLPQSSILMHPFSSSKCHLTLSIGKQRREYSHRMKGVDSAKIDEVTFDRTGKFVDITDMIVQYFKEKILEFVYRELWQRKQSEIIRLYSSIKSTCPLPQESSETLQDYPHVSEEFDIHSSVDSLSAHSNQSSSPFLIPPSIYKVYNTPSKYPYKYQHLTKEIPYPDDIDPSQTFPDHDIFQWHRQSSIRQFLPSEESFPFLSDPSLKIPKPIHPKTHSPCLLSPLSLQGDPTKSSSSLPNSHSYSLFGVSNPHIPTLTPYKDTSTLHTKKIPKLSLLLPSSAFTVAVNVQLESQDFPAISECICGFVVAYKVQISEMVQEVFDRTSSLSSSTAPSVLVTRPTSDTTGISNGEGLVSTTSGRAGDSGDASSGTEGLPEVQLDDNDEDSDLEECLLSLPLNCPLLRGRMVIPAKSTTCQHPTCFDLETFIEFSLSCGSWKCPCCFSTITYEMLRVDHDILEVLQNDKIAKNSELEEVPLLPRKNDHQKRFQIDFEKLEKLLTSVGSKTSQATKSLTSSTNGDDIQHPSEKTAEDETSEGSESEDSWMAALNKEDDERDISMDEEPKAGTDQILLSQMEKTKKSENGMVFNGESSYSDEFSDIVDALNYESAEDDFEPALGRRRFSRDVSNHISVSGLGTEDEPFDIE